MDAHQSVFSRIFFGESHVPKDSRSVSTADRSEPLEVRWMDGNNLDPALGILWIAAISVFGKEDLTANIDLAKKTITVSKRTTKAEPPFATLFEDPHYFPIIAESIRYGIDQLRTGHGTINLTNEHVQNILGFVNSSLKICNPEIVKMKSNQFVLTILAESVNKAIAKNFPLRGERKDKLRSSHDEDDENGFEFIPGKDKHVTLWDPNFLYQTSTLLTSINESSIKLQNKSRDSNDGFLLAGQVAAYKEAFFAIMKAYTIGFEARSSCCLGESETSKERSVTTILSGRIEDTTPSSPPNLRSTSDSRMSLPPAYNTASAPTPRVSENHSSSMPFPPPLHSTYSDGRSIITSSVPSQSSTYRPEPSYPSLSSSPSLQPTQAPVYSRPPSQTQTLSNAPTHTPTPTPPPSLVLSAW